MTDDEPTQVATQTGAADLVTGDLMTGDLVTEDLIVVEVSIDGMCGVY